MLPVFGAVSVSAVGIDPFENVCDSTTSDSPVCDPADGGNTISGEDGIILRTVRIVSFIVGVAAVIMLIFGGLKYITSAGDSNSVASAKSTILYAIIGLALAAFSQAIVIFLISRL